MKFRPCGARTGTTPVPYIPVPSRPLRPELKPTVEEPEERLALDEEGRVRERHTLLNGRLHGDR